MIMILKELDPIDFRVCAGAAKMIRLSSWLLEGPEWVLYRVLVDLAHELASSPDI